MKYIIPTFLIFALVSSGLSNPIDLAENALPSVESSELELEFPQFKLPPVSDSSNVEHEHNEMDDNLQNPELDKAVEEFLENHNNQLEEEEDEEEFQPMQELLSVYDELFDDAEKSLTQILDGLKKNHKYLEMPFVQMNKLMLKNVCRPLVSKAIKFASTHSKCAEEIYNESLSSKRDRSGEGYVLAGLGEVARILQVIENGLAKDNKRKEALVAKFYKGALHLKVGPSLTTFFDLVNEYHYYLSN